MSQTLHPESVQRLMREISALARAGLPLPQGLRALANGPNNDQVTRAALSLIHHLEQGKPLSEALAAAQPPAPPEIIALLQCADQSGDVAPLAEAAAESARATLRTRGALESLTAYPITVLAACFACYAFMVQKIMTQNLGAIKSLNLEISTLGRIVYWPVSSGYSDIVTVLCALVALILFSIVLLPGLRPILWKIGSILPGIRQLAQLGDFGNLMAFVSTLTQRGVPLPDALRAASAAMATDAVRQSALSMAAAAEQGQPVHSHTPYSLPATVGVILDQSERSGTFPAALDSLAVWCRDTFVHTERRSLARLEPALLLIVGIVVGVLVYTTYAPIFQAFGRVGLQ
jgi:type II secretory pathway component PulF